MTVELKERILREVTIETQIRNDGVNRVTVTFSNVSIGLSLQDILEYQKRTNGLGMPEFKDCDMITYALVYKEYSRDEIVDYQIEMLYAKATSNYVHGVVEDSKDEDGTVVPGLIGNVMPMFHPDADGASIVKVIVEDDSPWPSPNLHVDTSVDNILVITPECKERFEKYGTTNKKIKE